MLTPFRRQEYCQGQLEYPFLVANINPYNIEEKCTTLAEDLCYPQTALIKRYLDQSHVRSHLGVDAHVAEFQSCSERVSVVYDSRTAILTSLRRWVLLSLRRRMDSLRPSSI